MDFIVIPHLKFQEIQEIQRENLENVHFQEKPTTSVITQKIIWVGLPTLSRKY